MNLDMGFEKKSLAEYAWNVREGEPLGPKNFYVVNINKYGVYLASPFGEVTLIPSSTLPINIESGSKEVDLTKDSKDTTKSNKDNSLDTKDKNSLSKTISQKILPTDNAKTGK